MSDFPEDVTPIVFDKAELIVGSDGYFLQLTGTGGSVRNLQLNSEQFTPPTPMDLSEDDLASPYPHNTARVVTAAVYTLNRFGYKVTSDVGGNLPAGVVGSFLIQRDPDVAAAVQARVRRVLDNDPGGQAP